jgi:hypothetical protein
MAIKTPHPVNAVVIKAPEGVNRAVATNTYFNFTFWGVGHGNAKLISTKYARKVKNLARTMVGPHFLKFKYTGKSYRVKYKEGVIFLKFNRAHRTTLLLRNVTVKPFKRL